MNKTYVVKKKDIDRQWYLIDAKDKILGRLAARVAIILRGKHKPQFSPHLDTGDGVIVVNASQIRVTGKKLKEKLYRRYSGYPGGLKEVPLETMLNKNPTTIIKLAVKRMIPSGPLGRRLLKKLKVYSNSKHPHIAQSPKIIKFNYEPR